MDVLIVMKDGERRAEFEKVLRASGHGTRGVEAPAEGLEAAAKRAPDCVLFDEGAYPEGAESFRGDLETKCPHTTVPLVPVRKADTPAPVTSSLVKTVRVINDAIPRRVLLIDDKDITRRRLSAQLSNAGWVVEEAVDGSKAALSIIDGRTDCVMINAMIGGHPSSGLIRSIAIIRRTHPFPFPILVVTDLDSSQGAAKLLEAGADDVVGRASGFAVMSRRLQVALNLRTLLRENRFLKEQIANRERSEAVPA